MAIRLPLQWKKPAMFWIKWLWPASLAGRLVLLLISALAVAQLVLVLLLHTQQDAVVGQMLHNQTMSQTVTLARLLTAYPAEDSERLTSAFGSRHSCAQLSITPPPSVVMDDSEQRLAEVLQRMLHGVEAGPPQVLIDRSPAEQHTCRDVPSPYGKRQTPSTLNNQHSRIATVAMSVPLPNQRWLTVLTAVAIPSAWNYVTLWSFSLSSLAVVSVALVVMRIQTRSLRALAEASERFGRGESVALLDTNGPTEVASVAHAFNTMQQRLGRFMQDRLRLLASISHDLRTPLTTLRLKAEFIDDDAVRDDLITTMDELTAICEATLAFTRAEASSEPTQTLDMVLLIHEVAAAFSLAGAALEVAPSPPQPHTCRPIALKRALRNLIENALRYGQQAQISLVRQPHALLIRVEDHGPGIPVEQLEEAFQPFVRLETSRSTETGGIGLGLAIARSIVKAHGGTLSLSNRSAGGLCAQISLPV